MSKSSAIRLTRVLTDKVNSGTARTMDSRDVWWLVQNQIYILEASQLIIYLTNSNGETLMYEKLLYHAPNKSTYGYRDVATHQIIENKGDSLRLVSKQKHILQASQPIKYIANNRIELMEHDSSFYHPSDKRPVSLHHVRDMAQDSYIKARTWRWDSRGASARYPVNNITPYGVKISNWTDPNDADVSWEPLVKGVVTDRPLLQITVRPKNNVTGYRQNWR